VTPQVPPRSTLLGPRVDAIYVSFNRIVYTRESFTALRENTDWSLVGTLYVFDDASTDGTAEWLREAIDGFPCPVRFHGEPFGGPVAAMNLYLDYRDEWNQGHGEAAPDVFAKVDNDFVVCPGWLDELLAVLDRHPDLDVLGTEPFVGGPTAPPDPARTITPAPHVGGKGLIRSRIFDGGVRMNADGYQGWTQYQHQHEEISKAWITPDLPCFGLDQIPFEPWVSLAAEYVEKGWHRYWPPYHPAGTYWTWWTPEFM